ETMTVYGTGFDDTFGLTSSPIGTHVTFIGNAGVDTLVGQASSNAFTITGFNAGYLNTTDLSFIAVENLRGQVTDDTFQCQNGTQVTGTVDGQGGNDTLDDSLSAVGISVNLATGVATGTGGVSNIENVLGGSAADILIGDAVGNILWGNDGDDF